MKLDLSNSWDRLRWVESMVAGIRSVVRDVDEQSQRGELELTIASCGRHEHARFSLIRPVAIPNAVGFTTADIAINARSCLDMAVQAIVDVCDLPISNPFYPIEDNAAKGLGRRTKELVKALPLELGAALLSLQPVYRLVRFGRFDVPLHEVAIAIRDISNTNKHRNITPALRTWWSQGFTNSGDALGVELLMPGDESPWEIDDGAVLEVRYTKGEIDEDRLRLIRPTRGVALMLHETRLTDGDLSWSEVIPLAAFLDAAPLYVRLALETISEAYEEFQDRAVS